jgi:hypothetical protein
MAKRVILSVGTKRGLFLLESGTARRRWKVTGPLLKGWQVPYAMIDTRGTPRLHAAASSFTYAPTTLSATLGRLNLKPAEQAPAFPKLNPKAAKFVKQYGLDASNRIWIIQPGPKKQRKVLYLGTAPAGLFRSEDGGRSWQPVDGLNRHRTRKDWAPGAGGQALHSIQVDPHDENRIHVAISAAGSFRSDDGGQRWTPTNRCVSTYVGAPRGSDVGT